MKNLLKNNLRYVFKNKVMMIALFILLSIAVMVFGAFSNLSYQINKVYSNLVANYNLHNIVVNEMYSQNSSEAEEQKATFEQGLTDLGVDYRQFNSININNTETDELIKIIEYVASYSIDRLDVFSQNGLPINEQYKNYVLPNSLNFEDIITVASSELDATNPSTEVILARQKIVYFLTKAIWNDQSFLNTFQTAWNYIVQNPTYNPLQTNTTNTALNNVGSYLKGFLDKNDSKYSPIVVRGSRITATLTSFNSDIPVTAYFEDPYSYIAVVSNSYLTANNKEVYSFTQYRQDIVNGQIDTSTNPIDLLSNDVTSFPNLKSTSSITTLLSNIDDKYKIYINSIPYLIVGSGITPDFIYPILSFENTIPNALKEAIMYANSNGYQRAETSFQSSPHESFILAKYDGPLSKNTILNEINQLTRKSMSWPSNVTAAYWYNDTSNKQTPTALRIEFINSLITSFIAAVIILTGFVLILVTFVMAIFVRKFIEQNRVNIGITISNGISKNIVLLTISFVTTMICLVTCPIGLALANPMQVGIFSFLSSYWFLPTPLGSFNFGWYALVTIVPMILFVFFVFGIGKWLLKGSLVNLMKQNTSLKATKSYLIYRHLIGRTNVMFKFRSSIIFNSLTKIFFITLLSTLAMSTVTFASSATAKLSAAYGLEAQTNQSTYSIDLVTPTTAGGQYYGTSIQDVGRQLYNSDGTLLNGVGTDDSVYQDLYYDSPLFKTYSSLFWASSADQTLQKNDIMYIKDKVANQLVLNYFFGLGSLGTNPWNISKSLLPTNQMNSSTSLSTQLLERMLSDMRPYNQAFYTSLNNLTTITPNDETNAIAFPSKWVITNFNNQNDASTWALNYYNSPDIGIINASEIYNEDMSLRWVTPSDVNKDSNNLATILNTAYSTYGTTYTSETPSSDLSNRLYPKLYEQLFTSNAISNIKIGEDLVEFIVNANTNTTKSLITTRSMLLKSFMEKVTISSSSDLDDEDLILDPLDYNSYGLKLYGYKLTNVVKTAKIADDFALFFTHAYNDPTYVNLFYRIMNNYAVLNDNTDEPYVYINGTYTDSSDGDVKIIGIKNNSKFIKLYDNNNKLINNKLNSTSVGSNNIPLIVNNYVAKKYNLKVGSVIEVTTNNHASRYEFANTADAINALATDNAKINLKSIPKQNYEVVGINNTGNGAQFYISLTNAQKILGLATATDYKNKTNVTTISDDTSINVGMNNQWNSAGGFNGVFTSSTNPVMLTATVGVYSPSGLYPGSDSWITSNEMTTLVTKTMNNETTLPYLTNALGLTVTEFNNLKNQVINDLTNPITIETFAKRIISVLNNLYGNMAFSTVYENADSLSQQQVMFKQIAKTFDDIIISITILLLVLSLIIIVIISYMMINDLVNITAILTTLGYSNYTNALTFFSIFTPAWLLSMIISGFASGWIAQFMHTFLFTNLSLYVVVPFSWPTYITFGLAFTGVFALIFLWGLRWFKKSDLLNALKW